MMKRIFAFLLLLVQLAGFAATAGAAPAIPPRPTGQNIYVQDYAEIIASSDENRMTAWGQQLERETTAQLSVITVKSLDGMSIDEYALNVLRTWGIGQKGKDNGVLIVVAPNERKSRIEVGYGLEGILPDGLTGRIQDQRMLPYFRKGDYSEGITQGYATTASIILRKSGKGQLTDSKAAGSQQNAVAGKANKNLSLDDMLYGIGFIVLLIIDNLFLGGFITRMLLLLLFRGGGRGGRGGGFGGGSGGGGGSSRSW